MIATTTRTITAASTTLVPSMPPGSVTAATVPITPTATAATRCTATTSPVRPVSLSQAMNSRNDWLGYLTGKEYVVFKKLNDIVRMGPSEAYVFIDEHPDSINFGDFAVAMNDGVAPTRIHIIDYPASHHNRAGGLSFADGHAEIHKWRDDRTVKPITYSSLQLVVASPRNQDMVYMSEHASIRAE